MFCFAEGCADGVTDYRSQTSPATQRQMDRHTDEPANMTYYSADSTAHTHAHAQPSGERTFSTAKPHRCAHSLAPHKHHSPAPHMGELLYRVLHSLVSPVNYVDARVWVCDVALHEGPKPTEIGGHRGDAHHCALRCGQTDRQTDSQTHQKKGLHQCALYYFMPLLSDSCQRLYHVIP